MTVVALFGLSAVAFAQDAALRPIGDPKDKPKKKLNLLEEPELPVELRPAEEPLVPQQQGNPAKNQPSSPQSQEPTYLKERVQTVHVKGEVYSEEDLVGDYKQPEWTQHRRWPTTRVYVQQPPGAVEYEQWFEIRVPKDGGKENEVRLREELEFGLGSRLQLDIYLQQIYKQDRHEVENSVDWRSLSFEIRYALADWDEIFGNPTIYFEYIMSNGDYDKIEPKLLFGGQIAPGWHWGTNFVFEYELGEFDERTEEYKITLGISKTLIDKYLSLGIAAEAAYEAEYSDGIAHESSSGGGGGRSRELHVGPSLQFRPIPKAHIDIEPLWGCTGESKRLKMFIVFGWDF
jgi:hypothetical protein